MGWGVNVKGNCVTESKSLFQLRCQLCFENVTCVCATWINIMYFWTLQTCLDWLLC